MNTNTAVPDAVEPDVIELNEAESQLAADLPGDFAIWIFILAEMLVFGVLFIVYAFARAHQLEVFNASQLTLSRGLGTLNTVILISSSYFVVRSVAAIKVNNAKQSARWLIGAMVLGAMFVVVKLWEFSQKFSAGITLETNDFYMYYLTLTSFHLMHVLMGMIILACVVYKLNKGAYSAAEHFGVESGASFWHMVDLLWIVLFPLVYIIH
ncbi:cytochrome c oxidase subunit 3 family protein [Methylotenera mobilis]|uniref:Cytochrome c oxidase subunit III n=1 Tax=Methylotenera mobilis (strain JLW8 / ATCC BAA-1282 / DSM 17540) TaxID=583345 RepID=C6WVL2_METML|nr:cytochrome c oxidase subunit 3 family protein [Methylotenera mobilis]ACT47961.1 cytochrome c oxidase subunit III [Methylotenera mobilis JLW8]